MIVLGDCSSSLSSTLACVRMCKAETRAICKSARARSAPAVFGGGDARRHAEASGFRVVAAIAASSLRSFVRPVGRLVVGVGVVVVVVVVVESCDARAHLSRRLASTSITKDARARISATSQTVKQPAACSLARSPARLSTRPPVCNKPPSSSLASSRRHSGVSRQSTS